MMTPFSSAHSRPCRPRQGTHGIREPMLLVSFLLPIVVEVQRLVDRSALRVGHVRPKDVEFFLAPFSNNQRYCPLQFRERGDRDSRMLRCHNDGKHLTREAHRLSQGCRQIEMRQSSYRGGDERFHTPWNLLLLAKSNNHSFS